MLRLTLCPLSYAIFTKAERFFVSHLMELPYLQLLRQLKQRPPFHMRSASINHMMLRLAARHESRDLFQIYQAREERFEDEAGEFSPNDFVARAGLTELFQRD